MSLEHELVIEQLRNENYGLKTSCHYAAELISELKSKHEIAQKRIKTLEAELEALKNHMPVRLAIGRVKS